ncbi:serine/threonine protein kinase, partial [Nocardioides sp.]
MTITRVADRYRLDREVGRGACGAVWAANDEVLRRPVAIKRVGPPPGAEDTETVRAEREAQLAAQVNHPNVISVFDLIQDDDDHYWLVMEYVDGCPLSTIIREQGPVAPDELAGLLAPVADALAAAHQLGIVHRDVRPSNILVRTDGEAKLSDFGIARAAHDATLTQTGAVTGSPAYIAPEVATGGSATPASDVWSFGATLFHALSGRPPYHREGEDNAVLTVLFRIAHDDPPRLPTAGWLAPIVGMTMTRDPEARPTMAEVCDFLSEREPAPPESTLVIPAVAAPGTGSSTDLATVAFTPEPPKPSTPPAPEPPSPQPPAPPEGPPPPIPSRESGGRGRQAPGRRTVVIAAAAVAALVLLGLGLLLRNGAGGDPA